MHAAPPVRTREEVRQAKLALAAQLSEDREVVGVGIGGNPAEEGYVLAVTVTSKEAEARVPEQFQGIPVRVTVMGASRLLTD